MAKPSPEVVHDDDKEPRDAALYGRTSGPRQLTVPEQLKLCRKRADDLGARVRFVLKDEGLGAQNLERPHFQRVLQLADERRINLLVVWKLDRMVRSLQDLLNAYRWFEERGVGLVSVTEPFDTSTAFGRFSFRGIASAAELERDLIKERVSLGRARQAANGQWPSSTAPLGYRIGPDGRLEVEPTEVPVAKRIWSMYVARTPMTEMTLRLGEDGVVSRKGVPFSTNSIRGILNNPIYRGQETIMGITRARPELRLMAPRTWNAIQKRRQGPPVKNDASKRREQAIANVFEAYTSAHAEEQDGLVFSDVKKMNWQRQEVPQPARP